MNMKPEKLHLQKKHKNYQADTLSYKCPLEKLLQLFLRYTYPHFHDSLMKGSKRKTKQTSNNNFPPNFSFNTRVKNIGG